MTKNMCDVLICLYNYRAILHEVTPLESFFKQTIKNVGDKITN